MLLVRVTESERLFPHHVDRAPTVRPQSICQSVTAPIWLATAPTARLGGSRALERLAAERQSSMLRHRTQQQLIVAALRIQLRPTS
jgi:hypothetical protein